MEHIYHGFVTQENSQQIKWRKNELDATLPLESKHTTDQSAAHFDSLLGGREAAETHPSEHRVAADEMVPHAAQMRQRQILEKLTGLQKSPKCPKKKEQK